MKRILFILVFCFYFSSQVLAGEVKFAQLTDVHLDTISKNRGKRMLEQSQYLFSDAVSKINSTKGINFVVFTGDAINYPNTKFREKFYEITGRLNVPWYLTTGNHETNYLFHDKTYYSFVIDDFVFICMDGTIDMLRTSRGYFSPKELDWLDTQLTVYKDKHAVIFQHFPIIEPFKSPNHRIINANEYLKVLDKHNNVAAVVAGHYHFAKVIKRKGVLHICSPALVQSPNKFRIITAYTTPDGVKFKFEYK